MEDQGFCEEIQSFIHEVLDRHLKDPISTQPVSAYGKSDRRTFILPSIIVWDPLHQLFSGIIECDQCSKPLKVHRWKKGDHLRHAPRTLICIDQPILLISCVYRCTQKHEILSHDPRLLKMCEVQAIPFELKHKIGFTKKFMFYITSHVSAGLSFATIAETHQQLWQRESTTSTLVGLAH